MTIEELAASGEPYYGDLCLLIQKDKRIPSHQLRTAAVRLGLPSYLASTFADVAYWLQYAQYVRDNQTGAWLTGGQIEKRLGIDARTANRHIRLLKGLDLFRVTYAPAPGGPLLRVTWVFPTQLTVKFFAWTRSMDF